MRKKRLLLPVLLSLSLVLGACGEIVSSTGASNSAAQATSTPIPTAPAAARPTYTVQRGTVQETLIFSGRWMPRDQVSLAFESSGTVRGVYVQRGDTVNAGDVLADFDTTDLERQLASAQMNLDAAINNLESGSEGSMESVISAQFTLANANLSLESTKASAPWINLDNAVIGLEQANDTLEDARRAYNDAIGDPSTSASASDSAWQRVRDAEISLEQAWNSYYSAAQNYNSYVIQLEQAENTVIQRELDLQSALEGTGTDPDLLRSVAQAQLDLQDVETSLARSELTAPIDGMVLEVSIQAGDSVQAYNAVITMALPEPKEAIANLAFTDTQSLSVGMVGVCQVSNQPDTAVQCVVRQLPLSSRDADQTVRVAASLDDITLGQLIQIEMPLEVAEDVLWLPPAAIRTFQSRTFVVLQTPDGEQAVDVEIGLETDDRVEIVTGVSENDVVVGP